MVRFVSVALLVLAVLALCGCAKITAPNAAPAPQAAPAPVQSAQPAPPPAPAAAPATTGPPEYVYAGSDVPTVYHYRADCTAMRGTALEITFQQAQQNRMYPCPTCAPGAR